jgi:hypothetical protein
VNLTPAARGIVYVRKTPMLAQPSLLNGSYWPGCKYLYNNRSYCKGYQVHQSHTGCTIGPHRLSRRARSITRHLGCTSQSHSEWNVEQSLASGSRETDGPKWPPPPVQADIGTPGFQVESSSAKSIMEAVEGVQMELCEARRVGAALSAREDKTVSFPGPPTRPLVSFVPFTCPTPIEFVPVPYLKPSRQIFCMWIIP